MFTRLTILHEDDHLVCVSKPAGLLSATSARESGTNVVSALAELGYAGLRPVHRLDREVSGVLVLARDAETRELLAGAFGEREVRKVYWALVSGRPRRNTGELKYPIIEQGAGARVSAHGEQALTRYVTRVEHPTSTELEIDLVTGRRNQIRVHLAHAGWPIVGERKYARGKDSALRLNRRVALHAESLELPHPRGGTLRVEAPLPEELRDLVQRAAGC